MELFNLSGKRALITGSTKGIGEAIAKRFAEHGAKVVISSRKEDMCIKIRDEINKEFPIVLFQFHAILMKKINWQIL